MAQSRVLLEVVVGMREWVVHRETRVLGLKGVVEDVDLSQIRALLELTFNEISETVVKMNRHLGASVAR